MDSEKMAAWSSTTDSMPQDWLIVRLYAQGDRFVF
jgi:hypothetical protein